VRACIIGGGLAGTLLAWRLAGATSGWRIDLALGDRTDADATTASGGAVRGYEPDPEQRLLAIASLVELLASRTLRDWAGYRQTGSVYLRPGPEGVAAALADIEALLPASAEPVSALELAGLGWAGVHNGATGVLERHAGYLSPVRLRGGVLADGASRGVSVVPAAADRLTLGSESVRCELAGQPRDYDLVVLAAGGWTPGLLRSAGLPDGGFRTKSIQYSIFRAGDWRPPAFVDEIGGLYGRPTPDGGLLLGVPTDEWDVSPDRPPTTSELPDRAARLARDRFPKLQIGPPTRQVGSFDCYSSKPVLALRSVIGSDHRLFTFSGGSGGSAKTALAASHRAVIQLVDFGHTPDPVPVGPRKGQP
jgi:glycine/D-amino acid oxidase-like deaminating enzyme